MKILLCTLFIVAGLVYSSSPKITLKPFSIYFESPLMPFAIISLLSFLVLNDIQNRRSIKKEVERKAYFKGFEDGFSENFKDKKEKTKK